MILSDISDINVGVVLARKKAKYKTKSSFKYELFNLKVYEERKNDNKIEYEIFISDENLKEYIIKKGDLLFRLAFPLKLIEVDEGLEGKLVSNQYTIIRVNPNRYNSKFLKWFLEGKELEYQLEKYLVGTAVRTIPVIKIREIRIPKLKIDKQKEISLIIEKWDKQKELYNKMIEEKEKYYNSIINKVINGGKNK